MKIGLRFPFEHEKNIKDFFSMLFENEFIIDLDFWSEAYDDWSEAEDIEDLDAVFDYHGEYNDSESLVENILKMLHTETGLEFRCDDFLYQNYGYSVYDTVQKGQEPIMINVDQRLENDFLAAVEKVFGMDSDNIVFRIDSNNIVLKHPTLEPKKVKGQIHNIWYNMAHRQEIHEGFDIKYVESHEKKGVFTIGLFAQKGII